MSSWLVSIFFAAGASTWIYTKLQKYSGNNTKQSAIVTAICFVIIFFVFFSIVSLIIK